jgi:DNA-binding transcriptional regulator/RsmH inhibitor MraZ
MDQSKEQAIDEIKTVPIKLPEEFSSWFGRKVIITPGLHGSIMVFTPEKWQSLSKKMAENFNGLLEEHGDSFARYMFGAVIQSRVDDEGLVYVADFIIQRMDVSGAFQFTRGDGMLTIYTSKKLK